MTPKSIRSAFGGMAIISDTEYCGQPLPEMQRDNLDAKNDCHAK